MSAQSASREPIIAQHRAEMEAGLGVGARGQPVSTALRSLPQRQRGAEASARVGHAREFRPVRGQLEVDPDSRSIVLSSCRLLACGLSPTGQPTPGPPLTVATETSQRRGLERRSSRSGGTRARGALRRPHCLASGHFRQPTSRRSRQLAVNMAIVHHGVSTRACTCSSGTSPTVGAGLAATASWRRGRMATLRRPFGPGDGESARNGAA